MVLKKLVLTTLLIAAATSVTAGEISNSLRTDVARTVNQGQVVVDVGCGSMRADALDAVKEVRALEDAGKTDEAVELSNETRAMIRGCSNIPVADARFALRSKNQLLNYGSHNSQSVIDINN